MTVGGDLGNHQGTVVEIGFLDTAVRIECHIARAGKLNARATGATDEYPSVSRRDAQIEQRSAGNLPDNQVVIERALVEIKSLASEVVDE